VSKYGSEREERLLQQLLDRYQSLGIIVWGEVEGAPGTYAKVLVKSDGTVKVEGVTTISGDVDVSDRWARQLGQVDIARYLGSAIGSANPLHSQIVYGGVVIDPRSIRALVSSDVVTVYGSQAQALLQRATTYDLVVQLRSGGVEIDPRDRNWTISETLTVQATDLDIRNLVKTQDEVYAVLRTDLGVAYDARDRSWNLGASDVPDLSDRAARLLGKVYGNQDVLQQRLTTKELYVQISHQGTEKDPTQIRALTSSDIVTAYGSQTQALLQRATTYDLIVQLRSGGVEIDPRNRNWTISETVPISHANLDVALSTLFQAGQAIGALPAGTNNIGDVDVLTLPTIPQSTKHDAKTYKTAVFDASASGNLVAAVADKVIKLHALTIQAQGTVVVNLNNGSGGASLMEWSFQAREGAVIPMANAPAYWAKTGVNTALYVTLSAAVVVTITAIYSDDDSS